MPDNYPIELTSSKTDFAVCAAMMATQDPWVTLGFSDVDCLLAFPGDHRQVWIWINEEHIRGFIIVQHTGSFRGYIQTLCVHPAYQNSGAGSALLAFAEKQIADYSPNVFICVSSFNQKAHALYLRKGYQEVGVLKDFIKTGFDEILMRKTSGPNFHYQPPQS